MDTSVYMSIALMFAAYFAAGLGKLTVGPELLSWITSNPTSFLVWNSSVGNQIPVLPGGEVLLDPVSDLLEVRNVVTAANLFTVLLQMGVLLVIWNYRLTKLWILALEAEHLAIFFLTGVFFWKWMVLLLCLGLLLRPRAYRERWIVNGGNVGGVTSSQPLGSIRSLGAVVVVAFGLFTPGFPGLAWWDSGYMVRNNYTAVLVSGARVHLPEAVFLDAALIPLQSEDVSWSENDRLPRVDALGSASYDGAKDASNWCRAPERGELDYRVPHEPTMQLLESFVSAAQERGFGKDLSLTRIYPHHIWNSHDSFESIKGVSIDSFAAVEVSTVLTCTNSEGQVTESKTLDVQRFAVLRGIGGIMRIETGQE